MPIASQAVRVRDPRLDFYRGIAMFIILCAHTPGNFFTSWIPARWGFSDATEIFVFCSGMASAIAFGGATRLDGRRATRMLHPTLSAYGSKFAHARYGGFGSRWWRGAPCACGCGMILLGRGTVPTVKAGVGERGPKRLVGGARRHCIMCGRDYRMAS